MRRFLLILACLVLALPAWAQAPAPGAPAAGVDPAIAVAIDKAGADLHAVASQMRSAPLGDRDLHAGLAAIPAIQTRLSDSLASLTPRLQDLDARLAQLGAPPAAGQPPEAADTAAERKSLQRTREAINGLMKRDQLLAVEAGQTSKALMDQLRANFETRLWTRSGSILDPRTFGALEDEIPKDAARVGAVVAAQTAAATRAAQAPAKAAMLVLGAVAALFLIGPARLLLNRMGYGRAASDPEGSRLRKSGLAIWLVLVAGLTPLLAGLTVRAALAASGALTDEFDEIWRVCIAAASVAGGLEGLGRALLSPGHPAWRVAPIPDDLVARLAPFPGLVAAAGGLALFTSRLSSALGAALSTSVAGERVTVALEILAVGATLVTVTRGGRAHAVAHSRGRSAGPGESRLPWVLAALAAWLALAASVVAVLVGYLALAGFLMRETIWIGAVLAMLFLLVTFVDDLFPAALSPKAALGRTLRNAIVLPDHALEHLAVLLSGLCRVALLLLGWGTILLPLGTRPGDIFERITSTRAVFKIGQVTISPGAVLGSIGLFLLGLALTGGVRRWLELRYLPKTRMDAGVRTSLSALFSYVGAALAVLLAFAYLGLSFSQITLFASALSVGIGFGLQSIIGNFVSGLILLVERPVKVGDWVALGDLEGDVRAINIRATEIDMWDKSKLIVPNSELVSKTVRNVTHAGALGRVRIILLLDAAADPQAVREVVLARLRAHPKVVAAPAPNVFLTDVKNGALEFTAVAWVPSPRDAFGAKSELLFQIIPDLRAAGAALASSSAVVNVELAERPARAGAAGLSRAKGDLGLRKPPLHPPNWELPMRSAVVAALALGACLSALPALAEVLNFTAHLDGASETPPKPTNAKGEAHVTLDTQSKQLAWKVTYSGLSGPATAAHFHGPAAVGVAAGVAVPIPPPLTSPISGSATITDGQIAELKSRLWYVNIHTALNPAGEIRGQMLPDK